VRVIGAAIRFMVPCRCVLVSLGGAVRA
jgi:hypothetical protein